MNEMTRMSGKGQVVIPFAFRERMRLLPGLRFEVFQHGDDITLRPVRRANPFPRTTTSDLDALPTWQGSAKSIEEISRLSDETLREIFADQESDARD